MKPASPCDFDRLAPYFENQPYWLCAYSLSCLLVWNNSQYHPVVDTSSDMAIFSVCYTNPERACEEMILPVMKNHMIKPKKLASLAKTLHRYNIEFVPQGYIDKMGIHEIEKYFTIEATPPTDDYIYLQNDLANLSGNKYSKKRNLIHQFEREYVGTNRVQIEPLGFHNISDSLEYLEEWCAQRDCEDLEHLDLNAEKSAIANCITHIEDLKTASGLVIRIDGKVQAFGIVAPITKDVIALHFEKASSQHKGLYQYLDMRCALDLCDGYLYINKESDMGLEGLSRAKKSYHPIKIIKSYSLHCR